MNSINTWITCVCIINALPALLWTQFTCIIFIIPSLTVTIGGSGPEHSTLKTIRCIIFTGNAFFLTFLAIFIFIFNKAWWTNTARWIPSCRNTGQAIIWNRIASWAKFLIARYTAWVRITEKTISTITFRWIWTGFTTNVTSIIFYWTSLTFKGARLAKSRLIIKSIDTKTFRRGLPHCWTFCAFLAVPRTCYTLNTTINTKTSVIIITNNASFRALTIII